jgi:hypothetical protein
LQLEAQTLPGAPAPVLIVDPLSASRRAHYIGWPPGDRTVKTSRFFYVNLTVVWMANKWLEQLIEGKKPIAAVGKIDYTPLNC